MSDSHSGKMRSGAPYGLPDRYTDPKLIDALLKSSDPEAVAESGLSYQSFAAAYEKIAGKLQELNGELHDAWQGKDASAAQRQLREVWVAAKNVEHTANTFGAAVERHGSEYLDWYKYHKPRSTDLTDARNWMTGANDRIAESWNAMPSDLSTSLPPPPPDSPYRPTAAGTDFSGGGGSLTGGTHSTGVGDHRTQGASLPGSTSGADLADFSSGSPPSLTSGLSGGGGGLPGGGTASGLGTPGGVSGLGAGGVIGNPSGLSRSAAQNAAMTEEAQAARAASRSGLTGPVVGGGMGGGGGNQQEQERKRESWLPEDEETWGSDEVAPQVIGNEQPKPEAEPEASEPEIVDIDLTGDADIADLLNELNEEDEPADPAAEIAALRAKLERLERQAGEGNTPDDSTDGLGWMSD
jgi:hypothetical protein